MSQRPRLLCVVAAPRTGSTQLGRVLEAFDGVATHGEIFHPQAAFSLRRIVPALAERAGVELDKDVRAPATRAFVRANPMMVLDTLAEVYGPDRTVKFTLFPGHLGRRSAEVLGRPDLAALILRRRVVDSYASELKAREGRRWQDVDTTEVPVHGDLREFRRYVRDLRGWYRRCDRVVRRHQATVPVLTYESDIAPGEQTTLDRLGPALRSVGIDPGTPADSIRSLPRQDLTSDPADKFANWTAFEGRLRRWRLHDTAFGYVV